MKGELEKHKPTSAEQQPEQPRLEASDGSQIQWPKQYPPREMPIFLKAVGERYTLIYEKYMKEARNRKHSRESQKRFYNKRLQEDPEGFRTKNAARMRRSRAQKEQQAQEKSATDTSGNNTT